MDKIFIMFHRFMNSISLLAALGIFYGCASISTVNPYLGLDYPEKAYIKFFDYFDLNSVKAWTEGRSVDIRLNDFSFGTLFAPQYPFHGTNISLLSQSYLIVVVPPGDYTFDITAEAGSKLQAVPDFIDNEVTRRGEDDKTKPFVFEASESKRTGRFTVKEIKSNVLYNVATYTNQRPLRELIDTSFMFRFSIEKDQLRKISKIKVTASKHGMTIVHLEREGKEVKAIQSKIVLPVSTKSLDLMPDPNDFALLLDMLNEDNWGLRLYAATRLGALGDSKALEPLERALAKENNEHASFEIKKAINALKNK
jgi:hypothetical protein